MNKKFAIMKITNIMLTLNPVLPEADHIRYILSQLRHDHITPEEALKKNVRFQLS